MKIEQQTSNRVSPDYDNPNNEERGAVFYRTDRLLGRPAVHFEHEAKKPSRRNLQRLQQRPGAAMTERTKGEVIAELLDALKAAKEHLEYCGYGDSWERECAEAQGLQEKIEDAIAKAKGEHG